MTPETRQYPVVEAVIDRFARWLKHRRDIAESCNCNSEEYARIAQDLNLSTAELNTLVRRGDHASDELPQMMQALRIDADAIRRVEPMVMRDLERVCALCEHKRQCAHELAAGKAAADYTEFCPNADTLGRWSRNRIDRKRLVPRFRRSQYMGRRHPPTELITARRSSDMIGWFAKEAGMRIGDLIARCEDEAGAAETTTSLADVGLLADVAAAAAAQNVTVGEFAAMSVEHFVTHANHGDWTHMFGRLTRARDPGAAFLHHLLSDAVMNGAPSFPTHAAPRSF
ncbi:MAG: hypothetical protein JO134_03730 [Xanthobacteraceae bacterium]|nr:hypothetical protein [Xanthobacteraceae bacterium]